MSKIALSNGKVVESTEITKVSLWENPTRLQVDIGEDVPPVAVYAKTAREDADMLDAIREQEHLNFGVFRQRVQ